MAQYSPDANNADQLLQYAVQTGTSSDGKKMGATAVAEQAARSFVFIPPHVQSNGVGNVFLTGMFINRYGVLMDGFQHIFSTTNGATCKFKFRGSRIGIQLSKSAGYGQLSFDVDGTSYGTYNCADTATFHNLPVVIATNLTDAEHTLTITKLDVSTTSIQGFLVEYSNAGLNFVRAATDYFTAFSPLAPVSIAITDTVVTAVDSWLDNAVITNTTAAAINVTLKNTAATVIVGPFPVAANDFRTVPGRLYFAGGMKAIASAVGCTIAVGVQS